MPSLALMNLWINKMEKTAVYSRREEISVILRERVSPLLRNHGGDLTLKSISGSSVKVSFVGACQYCPSACETVEYVVQKILREELQDETIRVEIDNGISQDLLDEAKRILRKIN